VPVCDRRRDVVELHVVSDREPVSAGDFPTTMAERDRIAQEVSLLPLEQRTVMVLHFYLDLPLTEAAEILDIPAGTAKSRLHRGLATLRARLGRDSTDLYAVRERPA
jgi:RNA polymerase sigma factor (sigma-70 family)